MLFSAVILAAGKSERMGRDKAWLEVNGYPLILRQVELAREVGAAEVFISGRRDCNYSVLGCPVLTDRFPDTGPLAGIERGLAATSTPLLLALAVDLPRLTPSVLRRLLSHCTAQSGAIPRVKQLIEPLAAFYPRAAHQTLVANLDAGRKAVRVFAQDCVTKGLAEFVDLPDSTASAFANWNSPDDLTG